MSRCEQCKPLVIDTLKCLYDLDLSEDREIDTTNILGRPRIPHEMLFAVGGWSGGIPTNAIETYDTRADRWIMCHFGDPIGIIHFYHLIFTIINLKNFIVQIL